MRFSIYKFDALVKPFISALLIYLFFNLVFAEVATTPYRFMKQLYGTGESLGWPLTPLLFLPHLWVVFVFSCAILKAINYNDQRRFLRYGLLSTLLLIGVNCIDLFWARDVNFFGYTATLPGLPFSLDLVFLTSFYFILGYTTKQFAVTFTPNYYIFLLGCLFIYVAAYHFGVGISLNVRLIYNPIFSITAMFDRHLWRTNRL